MTCNCENCRGEVKTVKVFSVNYSYFWGTFEYCESAIEKEREKGNIVDTPDNYYPCKERQLALAVSVFN